MGRVGRLGCGPEDRHGEPESGGWKGEEYMVANGIFNQQCEKNSEGTMEEYFIGLGDENGGSSYGL